uniref:Uncharacterized protein n=1 Tax=Arundo donax TaxID=35708 RepID=A0A0A9B9M2_ARUDO
MALYHARSSRKVRRWRRWVAPPEGKGACSSAASCCWSPVASFSHAGCHGVERQNLRFHGGRSLCVR